MIASVFKVSEDIVAFSPHPEGDEEKFSASFELERGNGVIEMYGVEITFDDISDFVDDTIRIDENGVRRLTDEEMTQLFG